ncbi:hypothetical protein SLA2020_419090 [Shorea laevis]
MNLLGNDPFSGSSSYLDHEDILIRKLLLTHDPDGRHLDSELLLRVTEHIMLYATTSEVPVTSLSVSGRQFGAVAMNNESNAEELDSLESLGQAIYEISHQMICKCSGEGNPHMRTMVLFDMLGKYKWDAKMALVLAALVTSYGKFRLLMQLNPQDPLVASIAMLKQLPYDLSALKPRLKALSQLVKTMVDVTKCIIKFENLSLSYEGLDKEISVAKSYIYVASYWVIRSAFTCSSQITDLTPMKPEYSDSTVIATWELLSLVYRLSSICSCLRRQVDACHQQIERKISQKLLNLFQVTPMDNQEVLHTLFASTGDLPLKDCSSQAKLGVSELNNKVVMLLISKPELLPIENLLLLVQQTYDHPLNKKYKGSYEIVWFPIPSTNTWTDAEHRSGELCKTSMELHGGAPHGSVGFKGMVSNSNAIDMVMIWGARAYPFSASGEEVLWENQNWTLQLMIDEIDSLLAYWVEQDRNICIYGSENQEWIQEFNSKLKEIKSAVLLASAGEYEKVKTPTWQDHRHRSYSKGGVSIARLSDKGWAIIGKGSSTDIVKLQGKEILQCWNIFSQWGENVAKLGFLDAIKEAPEPCSHPNVIPYAEGLIEGTAICEKCKRPMKKYVVFE